TMPMAIVIDTSPPTENFREVPEGQTKDYIFTGYEEAPLEEILYHHKLPTTKDIDALRDEYNLEYNLRIELIDIREQSSVINALERIAEIFVTGNS
ncbi:MAG: hypothetical protein GY861_06025, partial [bacterium]|nr:hypothetical protein [bacterium]